MQAEMDYIGFTKRTDLTIDVLGEVLGVSLSRTARSNSMAPQSGNILLKDLSSADKDRLSAKSRGDWQVFDMVSQDPCFAEGHHVLDTNVKRMPYVSTYDWEASCDRVKNRPWKPYRWQPNPSRRQLSLGGQCTDRLYREPQSYCDMLRDKHILFVGDSITGLAYSSFRQLLGWHGEFKKGPTSVQVCNDRTTVQYIRNDLLDTECSNMPNCHAYGWAVAKADIVILNRGAHYEPDDKLREGMRTLAKYLVDVSARRPATAKPLHLFWRTTVPGHVGCDNSTEPMHPATAEIPPTTYHWDRFSHQNLVTRQVLDGDSHSCRSSTLTHSKCPG